MERVGVEEVFVSVGQKIGGPGLERRHWYATLDVLHDHHRELKSILRPKIHLLSLEDAIDRRLEVVGLEERYEMADLIQPVRGIEGSQLGHLGSAGGIL